MKVKIAQYYIGEQEQYLKLCDVVKELNSKYCQLHNYDYQFEHLTEEEAKRYIKDNSLFNILIYKLMFMRNQLLKNDCDYLVFIDADAAVSNPTIKIEDLIDNQHQIFLSKGNLRYDFIKFIQDLYVKLDNRLKDLNSLFNTKVETIGHELWDDGYQLTTYQSRINGGLYIIKNDKIALQFLNECIDYGDYFTDTVHVNPCADEEIILFCRQIKKYNDVTTYLCDQAQSTMVNSFEYAYNEDKTFILHNYGGAFTISQRIGYINQLKNNKWWKEIFKGDSE